MKIYKHFFVEIKSSRVQPRKRHAGTSSVDLITEIARFRAMRADLCSLRATKTRKRNHSTQPVIFSYNYITIDWRAGVRRR
jgi:hypothetical protein